MLSLVLFGETFTYVIAYIVVVVDISCSLAVRLSMECGPKFCFEVNFRFAVTITQFCT